MDTYIVHTLEESLPLTVSTGVGLYYVINSIIMVGGGLLRVSGSSERLKWDEWRPHTHLREVSDALPVTQSTGYGPSPFSPITTIKP